ncbi:hypothetical protein F443_19155 [Phytophthora nicotianae P1569]|uniref:Uncharacterized protein n=1 Tax=Phytophthora nicotianae P1569 TaxID=1317065 RepID=V9E7N0_PHYNI|nr:hypothetical protein F443_19155 [Phytophthora nicotianae P1569]
MSLFSCHSSVEEAFEGKTAQLFSIFGVAGHCHSIGQRPPRHISPVAALVSKKIKRVYTVSSAKTSSTLHEAGFGEDEELMEADADDHRSRSNKRKKPNDENVEPVVASRQPQEYGTIVLQIEEKEAQRLRAPNCCSRRLCHPGLSTVEKLRKFAQKVNIQEALPPLKTHRAHQANASVVLNTISWGQTLATRVEECGVVVTALHITTSSISKKRSRVARRD